MVALPPVWDALIDVVEGREAPSSCRVEDGVPRFSAKAIPVGAAQTLEPLVEVLRSDVPLPQQIRVWLADLMSLDANTDYRLKLTRRGRGQPRASVGRHWNVAIRFHELCETTTRQRALHQAREEAGLSRSATEKVIREYGEALREHERVLREG